MNLHSRILDQDDHGADNERPRRQGPTEQTEREQQEARLEASEQFDSRPALTPTSPSVAMQQVNLDEPQIICTSDNEHHLQHESTGPTPAETTLIMTSLDAKPTAAMTHIDLDKQHHQHYHHLQAHHQQHHHHQAQYQLEMTTAGQLQLQQQQQLQTAGSLPVNRPKPRGRRKKIRTEPIRPICPQCEKQFSNQSALTKHKLTHSDERRFACPQCSKAFKRHDHLTGHMQTHSNRKPFTCNIQGCDKTYCDARSLRRHKENIHHIVTPRDNNNNNNQNAGNISSTNLANSNHLQHQPLQNHQHHHNHQQQQLQLLSGGSGNPSNDHKLANGIHLVDNNNNNINTTTNNNINTHDSSNLHSSTLMGSLMNNTKNEINNQINGTNSPTYHQVDSTVSSSNTISTAIADQDHSIQLVGGPTIYSTTTATTNNDTNSDGNTATTTTSPSSTTTTATNHCNLNTSTTSNNGAPATQQLAPHQQQQQPAQQHEPSHLLRRRIQRLHSDQSGTYSCNADQLACFTVPPHSLGPPPPLTQPSGNSNHPHHVHHHHQNHYLNSNSNQHHIQHASFSADYASTQHFNFDFAHMNTQHHHGSHHHLGHSADLTPLGTPLEHTLSAGSVPHSADSVTDSGLGLNMHYEQHTPQTLPPPRYNHQLSHPQHPQSHHNQQAQQHHVSYSAGYATTQHFDFDLNNNNTSSTTSLAGNNSGNTATQQAPGSAQQISQSASAFDFAHMNGSNQQQSHHQALEHTLITGNVQPPHSADSVADSGLSLNLLYEQQHTPQPTLGPPRYHQQHQVSYSAGYATTQHFDFDFNNNTLQARGIES